MNRRLEKRAKEEQFSNSLDPAVRSLLQLKDEGTLGPTEFIVQDVLSANDFHALVKLDIEVGITEREGRNIINTGSYSGAAPQLPESILRDTLLQRFQKGLRSGHTHQGANFPHRPSMEDYKFGVERVGNPEYIADNVGIMVYSSTKADEEEINRYINKLNSLRGFGQLSYDDRVRDFGIKNKLILADVSWDDQARIPLLLDWINMKKLWEEICDNFTPPTK